jgi:hypothetical protein
MAKSSCRLSPLLAIEEICTQKNTINSRASSLTLLLLLPRSHPALLGRDPSLLDCFALLLHRLQK